MAGRRKKIFSKQTIIKIFFLMIILLLSVSGVLVINSESELRKRLIDSHKDSHVWWIDLPVFLEDQFYDVRMRQGLDQEYKSQDLVLAAVDDQSLQQMGRWPWSRNLWAELVTKMDHYGAKVLAYDVVFPEPEQMCFVNSESTNTVSPDENFALAIKQFQENAANNENKKIIISYSSTYQYWDEAQALKEIPPELFDYILSAKDAGGAQVEIEGIDNKTFPIPTLLAASPGLAYIGAVPDVDGIFRRYPLVKKMVGTSEVINQETAELAPGAGLFFPSYSLLSYTAQTGDNVELLVQDFGDQILSFKGGKIKLDYKGETKIRWRGDADIFDTISLLDIYRAPLDDENMKKRLAGKLVFIGSTAFAAHDLRHTPVDSKLPGVYYHMNMVQMLMDQHIFKPIDQSIYWSWIILAIGIVGLIGVSLFGHALYDTLFVIAFSVGLYFLDLKYFLPQGHQLTMVFIYFGVLGTYSINTILNFYFASKDKQFLKAIFGNYLSPELIDMMYESGERPSLGGDSGVRTAFFTDIQGFSTFSEKLSATKLVELLNEYLTVMTDILLGQQGTLDKYEGDAIIAFFGAPMKLVNHADRACLVAIKMQRAIHELRKKWTSEGEKWPSIVHEMRMRIGINSGEIVTGNMGSKSRMNYTMMGDAVNLAARLEEAAKQYGIFTHVTKFTKELCRDNFLWRELDSVKVVGKTEPITTFELLEETQGANENLKNLVVYFEKGLKHYKNQQWDLAMAAFEQSLECEYLRFPELKGKKTNPSEIYLERCQEFKKNPPPIDWDGVYTLTHK
jgi:adenylate cyclase